MNYGHWYLFFNDIVPKIVFNVLIVNIYNFFPSTYHLFPTRLFRKLIDIAQKRYNYIAHTIGHFRQSSDKHEALPERTEKLRLIAHLLFTEMELPRFVKVTIYHTYYGKVVKLQCYRISQNFWILKYQ